MDILELCADVAPSVLSILACVIAFLKGRGNTIKTAEQIEELAEAKKQKFIAKQNKKNKIKSDTKSESVENTQTNNQTNKADTITMLGGN